MIKWVVCVVVVTQMVASYGADTNNKLNHICLLYAKGGEFDPNVCQMVVVERHAPTSYEGHDKKLEFLAKITAQAFQQAAAIGGVLRELLKKYNFTAYTDSTPRSECTMQAILGEGAKYDKPKVPRTNELRIGLKESDFRFIKKCPGTLFDIVKRFEQSLPNTPQENLNFVESALEDLGMFVEANGLNTLKSFLNVIFGATMPLNVFSDMLQEVKIVSIPSSLQSCFDTMIYRLKTGKNLFCIHHSMFISSVLFFTELHEILQATSLADVYQKMNTNIKANPSKYLSQYLDLFVTCFTKYHIKNLDLMYMLYSYDKETRKHNFYICNLDYIKKYKLPLHEVLAPKTPTPVLRKMYSIMCAICNEPLKAPALILAKDNLKKKDCMLSVRDNTAESKSVGYIAASIAYIKNICRWLWNGIFQRRYTTLVPAASSTILSTVPLLK